MIIFRIKKYYFIDFNEWLVMIKLQQMTLFGNQYLNQNQSYYFQPGNHILMTSKIIK